MKGILKIKKNSKTSYYGALVKNDVLLLLKTLAKSEKSLLSRVRQGQNEKEKSLIEKYTFTYKNRIGWDAGCKFKVVSVGVVGGKIVFQCSFTGEQENWIEYLSVAHLKKEKCFQFDSNGKFEGAY